jgi:hypothetical protein
MQPLTTASGFDLISNRKCVFAAPSRELPLPPAYLSDEDGAISQLLSADIDGFQAAYRAHSILNAS